jgi:predicted SprT family Zn-dependent metalloprotease
MVRTARVFSSARLERHVVYYSHTCRQNDYREPRKGNTQRRQTTVCEQCPGQTSFTSFELTCDRRRVKIAPDLRKM